jgi:hypothetical protein
MSKKKNTKIDKDWKPEENREIETITSPEKARVLLHEDKKRILIELIRNGMMTIQQLSKATNINPGTIKRHIDDLIIQKIAYMQKTERSEYNIKMKYYSAVADKFKIDIEIP